jgi:transcriptional regulator with PAS, ATPase and Fis domain
MGDAFDRTLDVEAGAPSRRPYAPVEPHLVVGLECDRPLSLSARHRLGPGGTVVIGRGPVRSAERSGDHRALSLEIRVPDPRMSSVHARLEGALGRWTIRDAGSRNGVRVNGEPVVEHVLRHGDLVELGHTVFLYEEAVHGEHADDFDAANSDPVAPGLTTLVPELGEQFAKLRRLATTGVSVLLLGETGTGKEVVARAVHSLSGRPGKFVGVNSGALPQSLLESELFGSARRVRAVGATETVPVDLRLVSATNRDVEALVREGKFREDLFARIAAFRLNLLPLRQRRADLGILVGALLARVAPPDARVTLSVEAARALYGYRFPLNVRELENWLTTAVALSGGGPILPEHLPDPVDIGDEEDAPPDSPRPERVLSPEQEKHKAEIQALLREHHGNVSAVARAAGKARNQVQRWLKRYALDPDEYR